MWQVAAAKAAEKTAKRMSEQAVKAFKEHKGSGPNSKAGKTVAEAAAETFSDNESVAAESTISEMASVQRSTFSPPQRPGGTLKVSRLAEAKRSSAEPSSRAMDSRRSAVTATPANSSRGAAVKARPAQNAPAAAKKGGGKLPGTDEESTARAASAPAAVDKGGGSKWLGW